MPITKSANSLKMGFLCLPSSYQLVFLLRQLKDRYARNASNACKRVTRIKVRALMDSGEAGFIDITERQNRDMYLGGDLADDAWRSARSNREVLVVGNIPKHCIEDGFIV